MPRFLAEEIQELGVRRAKARPDAVELECSWAELYRLHFHTRLASRFFLPVSDFTAYNEEDLYYGILRKYDFTNQILPSQTFRIEAHPRDHVKLREQRFVAMKVKDAVADQFRNKFGERPSVGDEETADLRVVVRIVETKVSVASDLTGDSLAHRGYRRFAGEAPLRENVAAGLLRLAKWAPGQALVDPFCGSGTILIEAALVASGASALPRRRTFGFERLRGFQPEAFAEARAPSTRKAPPAKPFLFGYDRDPQVLDKARANARAAGVENWILFQQRDVRDLKAPTSVEPGLIITNPPYGERLENLEAVRQLMSDYSSVLKNQFKGWTAWMLSGNPEASEALRLKASRRAPVWNGPIECRFLSYPLR